MDPRRRAARDGRLGRAQALMGRDGLDALLLVNSLNLVHLAGFQSSVQTLARPSFLLLPLRGEPVLIIQVGRRPEALTHGWVADVRTYERLSMAPVDELVEVVTGLGLRRGRIGAELGYEQRMGLPVTEWSRLVEALHPAEVVDAAGLLWELRMVKDEMAIAAHRAAGAATARAYDALFAGLRPGDEDRTVCRQMRSLQLAEGGDTAWSMIAGGRGHYSLAGGTGVGARFEPGDMVWLDAGCAIEGAWSDYSRAAVLGPASRGQLETQAAVVTLIAEAVALVRPGLPVAELAAFCEAGLERLGLPVRVPVSGWAGRVGHGIGLDMTEPPHVSRADGTVLAAGMIISIEPGVATEDGVFHAEQNILVTPSGPEILSVAPSTLTEVALPRTRRPLDAGRG